MRSVCCLLVFVGAAIGPVRAAEDGVRRCRGLSGDSARLACYDAIPLTAGAAAVVPGQASDFGLEGRRSTQSPLPDAIESQIDGPFDGWLPKSRIALINGQVWEISDGSQAAYDSSMRPKVRVTRGMSGSFFLHVDKISQTPRVRRVY